MKELFSIIIVLTLVPASLFFAFRRPGAIIFLIFVFFGVELVLQSKIEALLSAPAATNIALAALVFIAMVIALDRTSLKLWLTSTQLLALALYAYAGLSLIWSPGAADLGTGILLTLPFSMINLILAPLIIQSSRFYAEFRSGFVVYSVPSLIVLIFLVEWQHRFLVSSAGYVFGNPLELSSLGGVLFVVSVVYAVQIARLRWIFLMICVLAVVPLFVGASRGQIVAAAIAALCGGAWASQRGGFVLPAILVSIMISSLILLDGILDGALTDSLLEVVASTGLFDAAKIDRYFDASIEQGTSVRLSAIAVMLTAWWNDPVSILFGLGNSAAYAPELLGIYPHNVPVEVLTEEGIVGFLAFGMFIVKILRIPFRRSGEDGRRALQDAAPFLALFVFYLIVSLKQGDLISSSLVFLAGILAERSVILSRRRMLKEVVDTGNAVQNVQT